MIDVAEESIQTHYQGVRILHTKKVPILDAAGHPMYLLGISEDITERRRIEKEQQFLAEVSVALSASLEYEQTLANVARLVVQNFADWSAVDVMDEEGQLSRLKVASADPDQAALCAVLEQMPPDRDLPHLMRSVIESKRPIVVEQVTSAVHRVACAGARTPAGTPGHWCHIVRRGAALDAGTAPWRAFSRLLDPVSRYRTGRSSFGRSAGGPSGYGDRECASLSLLCLRHATPRSSARRRGP